MAASCSHWWHAPVYVAISIALALAAITTSPRSHPNSQTPLSSKPDSLIGDQISSNASRSLRESGFNFMATLLQISPELLLPSSESTIFAIHDKAISNISLPPWLMKDLLLYHTSPSKLSLTDLLKQPQGSCLPTLLNGKNLSISSIDVRERLVKINGVLISHPDIFTQGLYSIHGVDAPFSSIDSLKRHQDWDFIQLPICGGNYTNSSVTSNVTGSRNKTVTTVPWNRILRLLSANGYVSFAIGLHSVLDRILQDHSHLNSLSIFAPSEFTYIASSSPMLERIVRFHIMPERFGHKELVSLPVKARLKTLDGGNALEITGNSNVKKVLSINGVRISKPDVYSSKEFVIHGISKPFELAKLWTN